MTKAVIVRRINGNQVTVQGIDRRGNATIVTRHAVRGMVTNPDERAGLFLRNAQEASDEALKGRERLKSTLATVGKAAEERLAELTGNRSRQARDERKVIKGTVEMLQKRLADAEAAVANTGADLARLTEQYPRFVPVVHSAGAAEVAADEAAA